LSAMERAATDPKQPFTLAAELGREFLLNRSLV